MAFHRTPPTVLGDLLFHSRKNIAEKKIHFLMDQIRTKYWLNTSTLDESFIIALARKSGKQEEDVRKLVKAIEFIQSRGKISSAELIDFNGKIEKFNSP